MEGLFTPRRSKIFRIGIVVLIVAFVLGAGAGFYLFIYPKLRSNDGDEETTAEPMRYFEGPAYYEEVGGEKRLLLVEGAIVEIDEESVTLTWEGEDYVIPKGAINRIVVVDLEDLLTASEEEPAASAQGLVYEDLFVGLFVRYDPGSGNITVDANDLNE